MILQVYSSEITNNKSYSLGWGMGERNIHFIHSRKANQSYQKRNEGEKYSGSVGTHSAWLEKV